jgi:hypothetical protein
VQSVTCSTLNELSQLCRCKLKFFSSGSAVRSGKFKLRKI